MNKTRKHGPQIAASLALIAIAGLGGCAASPSSSANPGTPSAAGPASANIGGIPVVGGHGVVNRHHGWLKKPHLTPPLVYVADSASNQVLIYQGGVNNPSPVGSIQYLISSPGAMWVDTYGDLFVANAGNGTVEAFFPGRLDPYLIINLPQGSTPQNVMVDPYENVWVASTTGPSTGAVTEYAHGTTTPSRVLTAGVYIPTGLTASAGNIYVVEQNQFHQGVGLWFQPGWSSGSDLHLQGLGSAGGGIGIGPEGTYVANTSGSTIEIYGGGHKSPTATITDGLSRPTQLAFDASSNLYVVNAAGTNVTVYAPNVNTVANTISTGLTGPSGVAVTGQKY